MTDTGRFGRHRKIAPFLPDQEAKRQRRAGRALDLPHAADWTDDAREGVLEPGMVL